MVEKERRNGRESGLGKLRCLLAEMKLAFAGGTPREALEPWYMEWQARNEPVPFWVETAVLELDGQKLELGEEGQAKRLELLWDTGTSAPVLRLELSSTRELHFVFRPPLAEECEDGQSAACGDDGLVVERREFDALAPLHPQTGLLNTGVNRRIHRKIDSRALRVELTRSVYERLREDGVCSHPSRMRRNEFFRAMRELAALDGRHAGFTGLLRDYPLDQLVAEAYGSEPVDELGPQLFLPVLESYLPLGGKSQEEPSQVRAGLWPTARPRASAVLDLDLWILLQQARAMAESSWSVALPAEALRPAPEGGKELLVECALRESVPCRRGELLLVEDEAGRRTGKLLVTAVGPEELCGRLRLESEWEAPGRAAVGLKVVPIRSSHGRVARALEGIREGVAWRRDIALSPAVRAFLGLEPLAVHLLERGAMEQRLRAQSIAEDPSQLQALRWAMDPRSPLVQIQGPPGTGKTTLIEEICREAVAAGLKVAVTGPSHPAVDNALRRLLDLPLLRVAASGENVSEPLREHWTRAPGAEKRFREGARRTGGFVIGGTHIGLMNDPAMAAMSRSGLRFDLVIVDEAGMSRPEELLLSLELGDRGVLIGDQQQLPPFPLSAAEIAGLEGLLGRPLLRRDRALLEASALEILVEERGFPAVLLTRNYRCHNPRLVELSSQLFYDSRIHLAPCSEYFRLPYLERQQMLGPESLRLYDTSELPSGLRSERTEWEGGAPGYCSPMEAAILLGELERLLRHYQAEELCLISPYRLQVQLLRQVLGRAAREAGGTGLALAPRLGLRSEKALERWLSENVTTIDSFQGRECDALLVSYVRSNRNRSSGFVGDPRRNNVTHTRARREMVIVGDLETLTGAQTAAPEPLAVRSAYVFRRMTEIVRRHGLIVPLHSEEPYLTALELVWSCLLKQELQTSAS